MSLNIGVSELVIQYYVMCKYIKDGYNNFYLFSLTIDTELNIRERMTLEDVYGNDHDLTPHHVRVMLAVGWACFLGSWLVNIAYYKVHPSAVDVFSLSDKWKLYVFGTDVFSSGNEKPSLHVEVEGEVLH